MPDTPPRGIPKPREPDASREAGRVPETSRPAPPPDFFRLLVESVQDYAIFALDVEGRVMTWSAGAARLKGYARTEILGRHFSIFYPDEDVAAGKPRRELDVAAQSGRLEDQGWRLRKDGTRFWASVVITALRDELGRLVGFAKVTRDLTARKRDEDSLRASEERFRLLVETVRDYAIFLLDPEGHVATWNAGAERIKGYSAEEIVGRHFSVFYPEDRVAARFPQYELEVAAREGRVEDEGWRVRKDGSQFWANVVITALRGADGRLVGFAKVTRDLTERRAAEEQARRLAAAEAARQEAERREEELQTLSEQLQHQAMELEQQTEEAQALSEELEQTNDELQRALTDAVTAREVAERAAARTQQLHSLTTRLASAATLDDVAGIVVAEITAATGATSGMMALRVPDADDAMIVRETGLHPDVLASYRRFALTRPGPAAECLRTGRAIFVESRTGPHGLLTRFSTIPEVWEKLRAHALATVPLDVAGATVGAMTFTFTAPREFSRDDRSFFLALGRQTAQAVERARLFAAEREARDQAEAARRRVAFLAEVSARLAGSLDVEATLRTVADLAVPALADWCFVELLERGRVRPVAVVHTDPEMVRLAHDVLVRYPIDLEAPFGTGKVLRTGESELNSEIPDEALASVAQDDWHLATLRRVGLRSSLSVPLKDAAGRAVAVLSLVAAESGRRFRDADLAMAEEVARRAGAALESARLYAAGQAALRRATALQRVSGALVGALSAESVAREVVHHGRVAVGAAAGSLVVLDVDGREFTTLATEGYHDATSSGFSRFPLTPGRPISDAVLQDAPAYLSSLTDFAARYPEMTGVMRGTGFEAYVALPIRTGARVTAGLSFSFAERREFDREDRAFFETLAAQAGQALERAHLVDAERAARAEAEAARAAAEDANRAKSEFLATMSHELRTPLNAIGGYAQLIDLGVRGPVTAEQHEDLERIMRSQSHLTGLINEVLNFARLEGHAVTYALAPTHLAGVIASTASLVEPQRLAKRIALDLRLPEATAAVQVLADQDKLQQILLNLLSNAVKFTPAEGRVTIELRSERDPRGRVVLRVHDTGIGIPRDKLEAIFEPFVQIGRSLSSPGEGTGLGLAIARTLARGMGGDLTADSVVGSGSILTLTLPAA